MKHVIKKKQEYRKNKIAFNTNNIPECKDCIYDDYDLDSKPFSYYLINLFKWIFYFIIFGLCLSLLGVIYRFLYSYYEKYKSNNN